MIDIAKTRDEIKKLADAAEAHIDKYAAEGVEESADEVAVQKARFEKMDKLKAQIEAANKLATYSFAAHSEGKQPEAATILMPTKSRDQIISEAADKEVQPTRDTYAAELSAWAGQQDEDTYATLTTTGNTVLVPKIVTEALTPFLPNVYRKALAAVGRAAESFGNTAPSSTPVITLSSGGALTEGGSSDTDASPSVGSITLTPSGYQSGTFWWSNMLVQSQSYDITSSTLPALEAAKDYGFSKAITAAIKADSNVTQSTTTASTSTVVIDNLDSLKQLIPSLYSGNIVIILATTAYNLFEKLKDTTGQPILQRNDIQGQKFLSYKGVPVLKDDTLDVMGASGNLVGLAIGMDGFAMRDEGSKLVRYVDVPTKPDQTGLNDIGYHAAGYVPAAIGKLLN